MAISDEQFRAAMTRFASGVTVITTRDAAGHAHGITVSAFCSVSAEPPLILACIHKQTGSHYAFIEQKVFVVHILGEHQRHISEQFALPAEDKFSDVELNESTGGLPVIAGSLVTLECEIVNTYDGGDHTIIIGKIIEAEINDDKPLIYFHGDYRQIGQ